MSTTTFTSLTRGSLAAVWNAKLVWLTQVIVNAALFVGFFFWLRIPDQHGWQFAVSVITGLAIAFLVLWLHTATFDYFRSSARSSNSNFTAELHRSAAHVPWFLLWTLLFAVVLWLIGQAWTYDAQLGGWARHALPEFLRRRVSQRSLISTFDGAMWFAFYFLWPIFFLPLGAQIASLGVRGFLGRALLAATRPFRDFHFWIIYAVCFLAGWYVPYKLAWHIPVQPSAMNAQTASWVLRLGLGYLLVVTAWLVVCAAMTICLKDESANDALSK